MSKKLESSVENFLKDEVALRGGICVKLNPAWYTGIPDRLVIVYGVPVFVELKRPKGGVISPMQAWWGRMLGKQSQRHCFVKSKDEVLSLLSSLAAERADAGLGHVADDDGDEQGHQ